MPRKTEKSKLLSVDLESTVTSEYELASNLCGFMEGNKKPLIAIIFLIFIAGTTTAIMLMLDHEGIWDKPDAIDYDWFNELLINKTTPKGLYPTWLNASTYSINIRDNKSLFKTEFDVEWNNVNINYNYTTLKAHCQLINNFATGYKYTRNHSYAIAMINGIDVLMNRFYDNDHGGFYYSINETVNGTVINYTKNSISHSSCINALSNAWLVDNKERYLDILNETITVFNNNFYDEYSGIFMNLTRDFAIIDTEYKLTLPLMYHIEALIPLIKIANKVRYTTFKNKLNEDELKEDANSIYNFIVDDLLVEYKYNTTIMYTILYDIYDYNWTINEDYFNLSISLNNAYKWSFLISSMVDNYIFTNNNVHPRTTAFNFIDYAINLGYDHAKNTIHDKIHYDPILEKFVYNPAINPPYYCVCNAIQTLTYYWDNIYNQQNNYWLDYLKSVILYFQTSYFDAIYSGIYYSRPNDLWKGNVTKVDLDCYSMATFVAQKKPT